MLINQKRGDQPPFSYRVNVITFALNRYEHWLSAKNRQFLFLPIPSRGSLRELQMTDYE
jgi:hypothetical protein